ncbi:MAG TPA: M1 family metallopeptidase [Candidatus Acidoferrales bacterium]|nr:M1 family metallopeptidase [Candidatus Acidoferrales bacterium]
MRPYPARAPILLALVASAFADNYPRQPGIDAQHYIFRVTLRDDTDEIDAQSTAILRFVQDGVKQFALDLAGPKAGKGMLVTAVTMAGMSLHYTHAADRLTIDLPWAPKPGEDREFTLAYHGIAAAGLHAVRNKFGERTFFSWNWPTLAHQWLPVIDHPSDKATSEFAVTAPARYQVVANGLLIESTDLPGGRRLTHWKESVPVAVWLNNIGVAPFTARHLGVADGVPLQTWVFPKDRENGIVTFDEPLRQSIEFFSSHIGPYPYEKLAAVETAQMGGGMEHASAIFFGERAVADRPAFSLVAHEVAHQWWGDSVTEKEWDDAWLSEGFATYFAVLAAEHYQGRDALLAAMKRSREIIFEAEKRTPGIAVVHDNLPEIQTGRAPSAIVYQKGGWTLHMLRGLIGAEAFWHGIREYYRRYRDANASTGDFRRVMEEAAGTDLRWFFDQWLGRAGSPTIDWSWTYDAPARKVVLHLTQTQPGDPYRLPMEVSLAGQIEKIDFSAKSQTFQFTHGKSPAAVELDPDTWVLMESRRQ